MLNSCYVDAYSSGCSVLILLIDDDKMYCANVGSNKAVFFKKTRYHFLESIDLTQNHTCKNG